MFQNFNSAFDYLLMLIIFLVQNVLIILYWRLCDFLVLKHINQVHALHVHLSFTDVDIFLYLKCSTISILLLIIYCCWLFFMCKMFLSFLIDVYEGCFSLLDRLWSFWLLVVILPRAVHRDLWSAPLRNVSRLALYTPSALKFSG